MANNESNVKILPEKVLLETDPGILESEEKKWKMQLKDVYRHGLSFYKEKEGKALHLSYDDRLKLVAFTQQTAHGPLDTTSASPLGVLDVIGRDRRAAWQALGKISQIQAMAGFVHTLDRLCPLFKPYLEAIHKDQENKEQQQLKKLVDDKSHIELQNRVIQEKHNQESNKLTEEQQIQRIKDALNAQSYDQFLQYSQQQYPGNFDQQAILIRQLQDQHYQQYIQQLAVDQRLDSSGLRQDFEGNIVKEKEDINCNESAVIDIVNNKALQTCEKSEVTDLVDDSTKYPEDSDNDDGFPPVEEAQMWTNKDIEQFKKSSTNSNGKLTVGHGETITIRVPTHSSAKSLCWEFATDNYDIGFGIYFEWSKPATTEMTICVQESDDDEPDEDAIGDEEVTVHGVSTDPELGGERRLFSNPRPPLSEIVPIYRRDSHQEVYVGSHTYPAEGVYLLKFDNTYSLWRSKTLYYKVYYTQ